MDAGKPQKTAAMRVESSLLSAGCAALMTEVFVVEEVKFLPWERRYQKRKSAAPINNFPMKSAIQIQ